MRTPLLLAMALLTVLSDSHAGNGAQNLAYDPISQSLAGAGAASGYSSAWLVINPAGLARLDPRFDLSFDYFYAESKLKAGGVMGNFTSGTMARQEHIFGGAIGMLTPFKGGVLGIGAFPLGGYNLEYPRPVRILPVLRLERSDRQNRYQHARVPLGVAWSLDNGWSVGATLDLDIKRIRTDHLTLQFQETEGRNSWDESFGAGFTFGVQKQWERWGIGAAYSSRHWMSRFQEYEDLLAHPLDGPQQLQAGLSYRANKKLEVLLDYKWIDWSGVAQFGREPLAGGTGWRDQHVLKLGLVYAPTSRLTVRGGISHGKSPVDENHAFINALAPVLFETHVAAGFSYKISSQTEVHASTVALLPARLTEHGGGDYLGAAGAGTRTELRAVGFHLGVSRKF